jgi:hypothetical protein
MRSLDSFIDYLRLRCWNKLGPRITHWILTMEVVASLDNLEGVATERLPEKFRFNKTLVECADRVTCRARKVALCL